MPDIEDTLWDSEWWQKDESLLSERNPGLSDDAADNTTTINGFTVPADESGEPLFGERTFIQANNDPETGEPVVTPSATRGRGETTATLYDVHEQRPEREQEIDESFNAPIADSPEQWVRNPDKYDWPGVDTIPPSRRLERATKAGDIAKDQGFVREINEIEADRSTVRGGTHAGGKIRFNPENISPGRTLGHEIGHALDRDLTPDEEDDRRRFSQRLVEDRDFFENLTAASEEARSAMQEDAYDPKTAEDTYRGQANELFADFVSVAVTAPQRAQAEFPDLLDEVRGETDFLDELHDFDSEPDADIR